ncbi:MAG: alpha-amylase, partial [Butyricicoccus sp.]|nr:alpha-amylase [Butyricicoccus sp.]
QPAPVPQPAPEPAPQPQQAASSADIADAFERGKIAGLQEAIIAIMEKNGPVTDQTRRDVLANVYHDSLITWVKSFR